PAFWLHRLPPRPPQPRNRQAKHLMGRWRRHWTNRVPGHLRGSIRELSRSMPPKQNIIERTTTTMVARGLHSDFSLGDSDANETDVRYWHKADMLNCADECPLLGANWTFDQPLLTNLDL